MQKWWKNVQKCHLKRFNQFSFNSFLSCRPALWIQRNANTCRAKLSVVRRERTVSQTLVVDVFKTTVTERQLYQSLKKTRCPRAHPLSEVKERKQTYFWLMESYWLLHSSEENKTKNTLKISINISLSLRLFLWCIKCTFKNCENLKSTTTVSTWHTKRSKTDFLMKVNHGATNYHHEKNSTVLYGYIILSFLLKKIKKETNHLSSYFGIHT